MHVGVHVLVSACVCFWVEKWSWMLDGVMFVTVITVARGVGVGGRYRADWMWSQR